MRNPAAASLVFFVVAALVDLGAAAGGLSPPSALPLADSRDAYEPAAAFGNGVFLVAWKSGHLAEGDLREGLTYIGDIVACRLDSSGGLLDAEPVAVCRAPDLQERPRIAFGGGVFLVVWQDIRNGKDWDVYAARVTPSGKVLDPDGMLVCGGPHNQALPELCWDGAAFQVVWQDYRSGTRYEVYGARLSPEGRVLDAGGRLLATEKPPFSRIAPVVASLGDGKSLLFWLGGGRLPGGRGGVVAGAHLVQGGRASGKPTFEDTNVRATPGGMTGHVPFPVCAAAGAKGFLVAWTTNAPYGRGNAPSDAHAAFFSPGGHLRRKLVLSTDQRGRRRAENSRIRNPSATWDGSAFVVAWDQIAGQGRDGVVKWPVEAVFSARIEPDGTVGQRQRVAGTTAAPAIKPAVASDGKGATLVAWEQHPDTPDTPIRIAFRVLKAPPAARK